MTAPLLDWTDWVAWRRRVASHGRQAVVAWLATAGGAVDSHDRYRLPPDLPRGKPQEWLEASLAEHGIPKDNRP